MANEEETMGWDAKREEREGGLSTGRWWREEEKTKMNEEQIKKTQHPLGCFLYKSRRAIGSRDAQRRLVHKKDAIFNSGSEPVQSRDAGKGGGGK